MLKRTLAAAAAAALAVTAISSATSAAGDMRAKTLRLIDVGPTIDVFLSGGDPSHTGDREVFRDSLVWAQGRNSAGKAEGHCTVIEAATRPSRLP